MRAISFAIALVFAVSTCAYEAGARSGGRGCTYVGGVGSSHKGGKYYNPSTGNKYQRRNAVGAASGSSFTPAHIGTTYGVPRAPDSPARFSDPATVPILSFTWRKQDGAMVGNFRIRNTNSFPIKDVVVRCTHTLQSTAVYTVGSNTHTIDQVIAPAEEISVKETNMGAISSDVAAARCFTTDYSRY